MAPGAGHVSHGEVAGAKRAAALFVPRTSVVTTTERTFVIETTKGARSGWM